MQLYEQHRPRTWTDVIGQEKAVRKAQTILKRGWGGRAWWLSGKSGVGKSSIGLIIAKEGADELNVMEMDGGDYSRIGASAASARSRPKWNVGPGKSNVAS